MEVFVAVNEPVDVPVPVDVTLLVNDLELVTVVVRDAVADALLENVSEPEQVSVSVRLAD